MMNLLEWYKNRSILILGGAGFIGSNLAEEFLTLEAHVTIVDGLIGESGGDLKNLQDISQKISLYSLNVQDLPNLALLISEADLIIDAMALTSHNVGFQNPCLDSDMNLMSHLHVIQALKGTKNKHVVYLGSRNQYGNCAGKLVTEDTPQEPLDPQSINKAAAEAFYKIFARRYGFNVTSLRITNCFGENQKTTGSDIGLIGTFIRDLMNEQVVTIYGSLGRRKSLLYVKDLVEIIVGLCPRSQESFCAYNVPGVDMSLESILKTIRMLVGSGSYRVEPFPETVKSIDVGDGILCGQKLEELLGKIDYRDIYVSLKNTVEYFLARTEGSRVR